MKTTKFLFTMLFFALILTACQKDEMVLDIDDQLELRNGEVPKMVPLKGTIKVLQVGTDTVVCFDPVTNIAVPIHGSHKVTGNVTHLGKIDSTQSDLSVLECTFSLAEGFATTFNNSVIKNAKGHGLRFEGTGYFNPAGQAWGYLDVVEGYGKFANATGWIEYTGNYLEEPGGTVYTVNGMVTQPNH